MKRKILLLILFFLVAISLSAQASLRKVIIGGDYNYPPYEYIDENNQPVGYNVELSRMICDQLGWTPEFRLAKWALVRQWLDAGEIDLVQGMAFSIDRAKELYFSEAHTQTWRAIFVPKGSAIKSVNDLNNSTLLVQQGDIAIDYLARIDFKGTLMEVPTQEDALKLLDSGDYDAGIVNFMNGMFILNQDRLKRVVPLPQRIQQKEYCYASNHEDMIEQINGALLTLSKTGQLAELQEKWLDSYEAALVPGSRAPNKLFYLFIPLLLALIGGSLWLWTMRRRYCQLQTAFTEEQTHRHNIEIELTRENSVFVRGPVILYKHKANPFKPVMISENIDQWGFTVDEYLSLGEDLKDVIFSEDRQRFFEQLEAMDASDYLIHRYRILTKSGEIRWILDYTVSVSSTVHERLYYGYLIDITAQKNMEAQLLITKEKAEAASMAKTHFLASMSHEIRTPLNGIMGFLQVLMQMDCTPEQKEYYEIMYSSGRSLMKIINDILDFSKIESGKLDLIKSDFNPRSLISDILKPFIYNNSKPELSIHSHINDRIPDIVHGDQLRLKQILINLLHNAVKFTDSGSVDINVDIYTQSTTDVRLLFCVSDTGIGIDPRKQRDIFDNFNQVDSQITSKYGGTGLGLSIVKRLVELMNGFIWVESEKGKGSSFFFIIPFECSTTEVTPISGQSLLSTAILPSLKEMRVLLVEDEPINQVVTKHQLEAWDIRVDLAANGQEALDLVWQSSYDVILMDVQMPIMDGITATQKLRQREKTSGAHTPVIAFTAAAMVGDRERFLEIGMDDYIAKPVEMKALHEMLSKYHKS
ncbi:MAG: transporter substrate-binding domain-containing protein [Candidatus Cloacimonetes bacterium]|nr:transporter substrate-binding domain-containing protein [Candidatus Cloacimonadota bacterium]